MILAKVKSQGGSAFILALMVVAAVGLLVVPVIYLATTGLRSTNLAQQRFLERYAADAGVEEAIWIIEHDPLYPPVPAATVSYDATFNNLLTKFDIEPVIRPTMTAPILSSNLPGGNMAIHKTVDPQYVAPCLVPCPKNVTFTYTIFIENFGGSEVKLDEIGDVRNFVFQVIANLLIKGRHFLGSFCKSIQMVI